MDDRELEQRLRARLHVRFDAATVPSDLAPAVRRAMASAQERVGFSLRLRGAPLGWAAVAAVAVIAIVGIVAGNIVGPIGPGNHPSPTPTVSATPAQRTFIVRPPAGVPAKPDSSLASDVLGARLRALGFGTFSSSIGDVMRFVLPAGGPSDESIKNVLGAVGAVEFVPLDAADIGDVDPTTLVGKPLPNARPALFGWEGIASFGIDTSNASPGLAITLKPAAAAAFADYTSAHAREYLAIVIDGRVALLPVINEPILGGEIVVSGDRNAPFAETAAILIGGMLPEAWRGATVSLEAPAPAP